jgi:hypothetical protein
MVGAGGQGGGETDGCRRLHHDFNIHELFLDPLN